MAIQSAYKSVKKSVKSLAVYDALLTHWPVPYRTKVVMTQFGETHVMISGSPQAKPLVLLHGAATNSTMWIYNMAALSKKFQVFAVDIIGEPGKSAGTRPSYQSDGHARWLKEVFVALEIQEAALCGLSLGGMLAYKFALHYPESVSSLALLAPPLSNPRFSVMYRAILANLIPTSFFTKYFLNYISASASQWPEWGVKAFAIPYQSYKFNFDRVPIITDHELSQLPANTLILIGKDEVLCDPYTVAARIRSTAPSIIVDILPGAKHTLSSDQPDLVNEKLLNFLC